MAGKRTKGRKGAKKKYQIEMTSFSIFIWTFCLFFLLTWIFVLGILVGRGFFPSAVTAISDIKGQIGKLQGMVGQNKSPEPAPTKKKESDPKLAFYDRLSNKKEVAQKKPTEVPHVSKKPLKAKKETKPKPPPQAPRPAPKPEPKPEKTVEKLKNEVTSPSRPARYTIQLASLELVSQAEKMSNGLVKRGFPAYFYDVEVKGKTYYRVRCGRFVTRKEAEVFVKKLKSEAGVKGFVTRLD
ncbi:MAG: SPOR domain-containing protein [Deltaproteobacteria bacterium]|nr:SPOR domain-containing protein [Deltaproteobacteria bacterium]MBW1941290.1 SPOR domain-containing protein [Deltaproteobacteria bacterium]